MTTLLTLVLIASGVLGTICVLSQKSSGSGLSDLFGGAGGGAVGASAAGVKNLVRLTKINLAIFITASFLLAVIAR